MAKCEPYIRILIGEQLLCSVPFRTYFLEAVIKDLQDKLIELNREKVTPMRSEAEMTQEELDEVLGNLEKAGMILWDRGAGLVTPTEAGRGHLRTHTQGKGDHRLDDGGGPAWSLRRGRRSRDVNSSIKSKIESINLTLREYFCR